jgi:hypothetical protein
VRAVAELRQRRAAVQGLSTALPDSAKAISMEEVRGDRVGE